MGRVLPCFRVTEFSHRSTAMTASSSSTHVLRHNLQWASASEILQVKPEGVLLKDNNWLDSYNFEYN